MNTGERAPFSFHVEPISADVLSIRYSGYLGEADVEPVRRIDRFLDDATTTVGLLFDIGELKGFHRTQIPVHVDVFQRQGPKIRGSAVLGANAAARFAAISASLMARMQLKTFDTEREAIAWLRTIASVPTSRRR